MGGVGGPRRVEQFELAIGRCLSVGVASVFGGGAGKRLLVIGE